MKSSNFAGFCLALVIAASGALFSGCGSGETGKDRPSAEPGKSTAGGERSAKPQRQEPAFSVVAEELAKEYADDKDAADAKYKGKWLEVEAKYDTAVTNIADQRTVLMKGYTDFAGDKLLICSVRCVFVRADQEKTNNLTKGQQIKFTCRCDGYNVLFVDLLDCEVIEIGKDPAIAVTAVQVSQEYLDDKDAAEEKYYEKQLLVEGVVVGPFKNDEGADGVILEGANEDAEKPLRVIAHYALDLAGEFQALNKGDRVKVKGECGGIYEGVISMNSCVLVK